MNRLIKYVMLAISPWILAKLIGRRRLVPISRTTLYVQGRNLYDTNEKKVVLKGINLQLLDDWSFPATDKFPR